MVMKLHATFDGKVFLPRESMNIKPNTDWIIVISDEKVETYGMEELHPLEVIAQLSTNMGPADLSENFEHYSGRRLKVSNE